MPRPSATYHDAHLQEMLSRSLQLQCLNCPKQFTTVKAFQDQHDNAHSPTPLVSSRPSVSRHWQHKPSVRCMPVTVPQIRFICPVRKPGRDPVQRGASQTHGDTSEQGRNPEKSVAFPSPAGWRSCIGRYPMLPSLINHVIRAHPNRQRVGIDGSALLPPRGSRHGTHVLAPQSKSNCYTHRELQDST